MFINQLYCIAVTLFILLQCKSSLSASPECEFSNLDYKDFVTGGNGLVETSEPLRLDVINSPLPKLGLTKASIFNGTFSGMSDCKTILAECDKNAKNELTFQYNLRCPHLIMAHLYAADGKLGGAVVEGHGIGRNDFEDYVIKINGIYESITGKDKIQRPFVKSFKIETEPKGIVKFHTENLYHKDTERSTYFV